jgi:Dual specificity phosphatase, catalytic domain
MSHPKQTYKFAAASSDEILVFGAARPGYTPDQVQAWLQFMQSQSIQRVCCLLTERQLQRYGSPTALLETYRQTFGAEQVCWAPIDDFQLATPDLLCYTILPFLGAAQQTQQPVVVHCSGGVGRTGHVLAAWLVASRRLSNQAAIAAITQMGKNPREAIFAAPFFGRNPWRMATELQALLDAGRYHPVI